MRKRNQESGARSRVLVLVDESNVGSSVRTAGRGLDWLKLRDFLAGPNTGRDLIEMVVYSGLPPAIPTWQDERDRKNKFVHWLRSNGFMAVTKDGAPAEEGHYKANVDVMMAIDALELSIEMRPDVVILVTGRRRFRLSRHQAAPARDPRGSRISCRESREHIEISRERRDRSGAALSDVRDHQQFDVGRARAGGPATRSPAGAGDERPTRVQAAPRRYRIERRGSSNSADAGLGFVPLLRHDNRAKVDVYGAQQRQRQR